MGDAGCMPHVLPGMPESWPWESSREAIEGLFLQEFADNGCFSCHASGAQGAEVVFSRLAPPGPLTAPFDGYYEESKANMWNVLTTSEEATFDTAVPVGRLWFHMPNYPLAAGEDNDPQYDAMDTNGEALLVVRMNRLLARARACNNTKYAQMPADAGSNCGSGGPRDAGPISESDGGDLDGGVVDGGSGGGGGGSGGLCYCELELNYAPDLLLYCSE